MINTNYSGSCNQYKTPPLVSFHGSRRCLRSCWSHTHLWVPLLMPSITRKGGICDVLQFEASQHRASRSGPVIGRICTAHAQKILLSSWASGQNSDSAIRFADSDFLIEKIGHIFMFNLFDLMMWNICHMLRSALQWFSPCSNFEVGWTILS